MRPDGITSRRAEFAVPDDVAYFNTANLGPLLHTVRDAGERALQRRAAPWTGSPTSSGYVRWWGG